MTTEFGFIGWSTEGTSDKIWGYFYRPTPDLNPAILRHSWRDKNYGRNACTFWGRRGKAMQFKASVVNDDLEKLKQSKLNKGYEAISEDKLMKIWPTFITEAEGKLMWEVLAGKVK